MLEERYCVRRYETFNSTTLHVEPIRKSYSPDYPKYLLAAGTLKACEAAAQLLRDEGEDIKIYGVD